jgi:hypothetical protein
MKALENRFRFFEPRGICSSSGYVSGASASGSSGGGSALTQSILSAVPLAAEEINLGASSPSLAAAPSATPVNTPTVVSKLNTSSLTTWLVILVAVGLGIFAFEKL